MRGLKFKIKGYPYIVEEITDIEIEAVRLDKEGKPTNKRRKFARGNWPPDGYAEYTEESSHEEPSQTSANDTANTTASANNKKNTGFDFRYDEERQQFLAYKDNVLVSGIKCITAKGKDGEDGKNAYELWAEINGRNHVPKEELTKEAFLEAFKGDKGEDANKWSIDENGNWCCNGVATPYKAVGESAFEAWKKLDPSRASDTPKDFLQWLASQVETQKGEDGVTYIPHFNEKGELYFVNSNSKAKTVPFPVKGQDGKIFYPHIDGYELYFTEDKDGQGVEVLPRVNLRGEQGRQGRTFTPKFEGTELHFEDGEGECTKSIDLKGKDAFELWKENHHKPDAKYEEFEDYFRGQNVKADFSYLNVKDFTCPVQKIDTDLIVNIHDAAQDPDTIIKIRQSDIKNLRGKGNEVFEGKKAKNSWFFNGNFIFKNWAGWFKEFSWWCAGADRPLLRMCPGDHSKYTGIGTVILFTALMAWLSSFYAMEFVFHNHYISIAFATFWASLIFFLDRFITNTMYSDGKHSISWKEFTTGLPRIIIAIILGIVISAPLELKIFEKEIDNRINIELKEENKKAILEKRDAKINVQDSIIESYKGMILAQAKVELWRNKIKEMDTLRKQEKDSLNLEKVKYETGSQGKNESLDAYNKRSAANTTKQNSANVDIKLTEEAKIDDKFDAKTKPLHDSISAHLIDTNKVKSYISEAETRKDTIISDYSKVLAKADSMFMANIGLETRLSALHDIAMKDYKPLVTNKNIDNIVKPSVSAIMITLLLFAFRLKRHSIRKNGIKIICAIGLGVILGWNYEIFYSIFYYLFTTPIGLIMLLFILIDISPVLYKMMLADGVYDNYLHEDKSLAQDRIRLSLARMLKGVEKGDLKSLSPYIMGKTYRRLMKSVNEEHINWENNRNTLNDKIAETNKEVFKEVLDYKRRIILASYAAWYRNMRDAMIGSKDDEEGSGINPKNHLSDDKPTGEDASSDPKGGNGNGDDGK